MNPGNQRGRTMGEPGRLPGFPRAAIRKMKLGCALGADWKYNAMELFAKVHFDLDIGLIWVGVDDQQARVRKKSMRAIRRLRFLWKLVQPLFVLSPESAGVHQLALPADTRYNEPTPL